MVRFTPADGKIVEKKLSSRNAEIQFMIECNNDYRFGYRETARDPGETNEKEAVPWHYLGSVANHIMTRDPPIGAPFTGMMIGLYAIGENEPCTVPADFKFAEFRPA